MGWADVCGGGRRGSHRARMVLRPEYGRAALWRISCRGRGAGDADTERARAWRRRTRGDRGSCGVSPPRPRPGALDDDGILLATAPRLCLPLVRDMDRRWFIN